MNSEQLPSHTEIKSINNQELRDSEYLPHKTILYLDHCLNFLIGNGFSDEILVLNYGADGITRIH